MDGLEDHQGNVAEEVRKLKKQPGKELLLSGSSQLFNALMKENLIDLYRFMRLFPDGVNASTALDLLETQRFSAGIVILEYRPAKKAAA